MPKPTLVTNLTIHLVTTLLIFTSAFSATTFAASKKQQPVTFGEDIAMRCVELHDKLNQPVAITAKDSFDGNIQQLEQILTPAYNLLFESFLYANVLSDSKLIKAAEQCQLSAAVNIDAFLGSQTVTSVLDNAEPYAKTPLQIRVLKKYRYRNKLLGNEDFASLKAQGKEASVLFRKGTKDKVKEKFKLPPNCANGLEDKYKKRYVKNDRIDAQIEGSTYATFIRRLPDEQCRKMAYAQYQGRHSKTNQEHLFDMLSLRDQSGKALGFDNYAQLQLQSTMIESPKDVEAFLKGIVKKEPEAPAPWNFYYLQEQQEELEKTNDVNESLTPEQAHQGLFTLLETEFGLQVRKLDEPAWHKSVSVYMLKQAGEQGKDIGKFYLDLYPRKKKYPNNRHRAMRRGITDVQMPVSALILNLPEDEWQQTHLKSFFHEFGHLLHNLVSIQPYHVVAGISIERDLVEMPAKWFEWLSFDPAMQKRMFGKVVATTEKPDTGTKFRLRLFKAAQGLAFYSQPVTAANIEQINAKLSQIYLGHPYPKGASNQYSFSHLGTYGPRYYSYIWSEAIARRLLEDYMAKRYTGEDYLHFLFEQGSSIKMTEMISKLYKKPVTLQDIILWVANEKDL
ncbi:hypothetical protein E2K93_05445 [Thalassotalea sp. HSM 43]|uniref:M3 family metallopeptidase n=1 Tax=Thalassotalea sp. HSM 43 TaxID=2552945 RepID=UPI001080C574|nr:M3 family metallopeptidase [Thalassotalea sp. HSM 43]QBY03859.1 hypothetical protein E2K93_05445 [Thalassotalea sp. HSM 43]